jgi:ribonuclease P protein component
MLPKQNRLPRTAFSMVLKTGFRIHSPDITCVSVKTTDPVSRFAVVVSKKIAKRAVDRNRIKRLVREAIHHLLPAMKSGFDCVFITKNNFAEKEESVVEKDIKGLLVKIT